MARLAQTVILWDEKAQKPIVLEAGSKPAKWAADQITNPKAWAPDEEPTPDGGEPDPAGDDDTTSEEPPREGKGSGITAWRAYAKEIGVEFDKKAKVEEIIAAVDAAKDVDDPEEPSREDADLEEWQAYAEAKGFEVGEDATVEEIIAAIDADSDES